MGISLDVLPVVIGLDSVRLGLKLSASSVSSVEGLVDVATNQRDITTQVIIQPGQIVRLGGWFHAILINQMDRCRFLQICQLLELCLPLSVKIF